MVPVMLQRLQFQRGSFRLEIPKLQIEAGSVVGLVGRNGAGKSTLFELLSGQLAVQQGEIQIFGMDPHQNPVEVRRKTAWMSPDQPLFRFAWMRSFGRFRASIPRGSRSLRPNWCSDLGCLFISILRNYRWGGSAVEVASGPGLASSVGFVG